ncbi:hypothetical protein LINPERHAP1_LOCUS8965 [Linum perenne]
MDVGATRVGRCTVIKCCFVCVMTPLKLLCGELLTCEHC